jgi:sugar lactone lactonase YvrE
MRVNADQMAADQMAHRMQLLEMGDKHMGGGAMQTNSTNRMSSVRSLAVGTWVALLSLLTLCLYAPAAIAGPPPAPAVPIVVTGTSVLIGDMGFKSAGGGWFSGQAPLGGTFVAGPNGDVIVGDGYGKGVFLITPSGTQTVLATLNNSNAAGMDQYGNAYIAHDYGAAIYKVPYNAATAQYVGYTTTPTANCLGGTQDTAACIFAPGTQSVISAGATAGGGNPGFTSLFFDGKGNFFFVTDTNPGGAGSNSNTIYECSAKCQAETDGAGTNPPVVVFVDTVPIGVVSVDPWGNLFFSDGFTNGADTGTVSNVKELPLQSGTYAASPTLLVSYTTTAAYNGISGVVAGNQGAVYFTVPNDGIFAIPNSSSGPNAAGIYKVSTQGGKGMTMDAAGNLYVVQYSNTLGNDGVFVTPMMNNIGSGASPVGTAAAPVTATVIDNNGACTPALTFTANELGKSTSEFTAAAGTSCSAAIGTSNGTFSPAPAAAGSVLSVTVTFTPTTVGARSASLAISDGAGGAGTAAVYGIGQGPFVNLDPGTSTVVSSGLTSPSSVVGDAAGDVIVADSGAGAVYEVAAGTTTLTAIGSGFKNPAALAFDAAGDLLIADSGLPALIEIKNAGTASAFVAGSQSTLVGSGVNFGEMQLDSPVGLAVGPDGRVYIVDSAAARVSVFDLDTGAGGPTNANASTGLMGPTGVAVDGSNNLYVADPIAGGVYEFSASGTITPISAPGVTEPSGVAVDASGSLVIADMASGNIVRVPNQAGTLTTSKTITIESVPAQATSLTSDSLGDIGIADASNKWAYAIWRTSASVNLGVATDGATPATGIVYFENAGNATTTLATPAVTEPTNTFFTLTAGPTNGCDDGSSGPAGAACELIAAFAPTGTANEAETATATVASNAADAPSMVTISGTATTSSLATQAITFTVQPTAFLGQVITLSATATSDLPVTFTSGTPTVCTVSGTSATFNALGACKIDANQAGNASFQAAPQVIGTVTITSPSPAGVPSFLMTQVSWLNPTGSFTDGQNPQGGSFAVTQNGEIAVGTSYSNKVYFVNASTGATISTVAFNGPGGLTIDSNNNLYVSHLYNSIIYKVPFVNGAYATLTDNPSPAPPACTGSDTAECTFATANQNTKAIAFDEAGNFYMVSEPATSASGASGIYECSTSCQPAGTATEVYADANGVSQIAFDPWGNMFFTDSNYLVSGSNDVGNSGASSSSLWELPFTTGTGFAATPTLLQAFTNTSPGNYDDALASVAVSPVDGTIYYGILYDGTYAIPNTKTGGPALADSYAVSAQAAKAFTADPNGNLYVVANTSGADTVGLILIGDMQAPTAQFDGPAVTSAATVVDNTLGCGTAATLAVASSNPEFTVTAGGSCSGVGVSSGNGTLTHPTLPASSYAATISFAATVDGKQTANLTITDPAHGGEGTATVTGLGQKTAQTITFTAPVTTTYTWSPTLAVVVTATAGASGSPVSFSIDSTSTGAATLSAVTQIGNTYTATVTVTTGGVITVDASEAAGLANGVYYESALAQLPLTISGAAQSIAFAAPITPVVYAPGETIPLTAVSSAGLPVAFTLDAATTAGAATIADGVVTVTGTGSIVIDAGQAGTADYAAATTVSHTVTVTPATQAIAFGATTPAAPIYYLASIQIAVTATGGASANPVTFALDSTSQVQGTVSATTLTGNVSSATITVTSTNPTPSTGAKILIDANQLGTANYAAAPQAQLSITLLPALPTQTIAFPSPGTQVIGTVSKPTTVTLQATASSGLPVSYASTTTDVCTVSGGVATMLTTGTCTVTASQAGDNKNFAAAVPVSVSFMVNPTGDLPSIALSFTLPSLTVQPGTVGLTYLTVTSTNNFTGSVSFACSGLPSGYTCTFNPNPVMVPQGAATTTSLSVSPSSTASAMNHKSGPLFPAATLAIALCFLGFRKRNRLQLLMLLAVSVAGFALISGCGGSSTTTTTKPVTSKVTVTATSGNVQQTASFSMTVE